VLEDGSAVFMLPILELPLDHFRHLVTEALRQHHLTAGFLSVFPFQEVVRTGLESMSEHWAGLALNWARRMDSNDGLRDSLKILAEHGPTQQLRHQALRVLSSKSTQ
jgi:hypothetical protein